MSDQLSTHVECIEPILRVEDRSVRIRYSVEVLGFEKAVWGNDDFTHVGRDGKGIDLCRSAQGHAGSWVWIGVGDVRALHGTDKGRGAIIRQEPTNEPGRLEMQIEDPDGNVLRYGSDSEGSG